MNKPDKVQWLLIAVLITAEILAYGYAYLNNRHLHPTTVDYRYK